MLKLYCLQRCNDFEAEKGTKEQVIETIENLLKIKNYTEKEERKLAAMLTDLHSKPKYEGFLSRTFQAGEINITKFTILKDGRVKTKSELAINVEKLLTPGSFENWKSKMNSSSVQGEIF